jgi:hypothetical protein
MTLLAPTLQAFFTDRLTKQLHASRARSPPTATACACCCASPTTRPGASRRRWTGTTSTSR